MENFKLASAFLACPLQQWYFLGLVSQEHPGKSDTWEAISSSWKVCAEGLRASRNRCSLAEHWHPSTGADTPMFSEELRVLAAMGVSLATSTLKIPALGQARERQL